MSGFRFFLLLALLLGACSLTQVAPPQPASQLTDIDLTATAAVVGGQTPSAAHHLTPAAPASASTSVSTLLPGAKSVGRFDVYEFEFPWPSASYSNPWEQVQVSVTLTAPSGRTTTIGGFYYAANIWRARFSPDETGIWNWRAHMSDKSQSKDFAGSFTVTDSSSPGFVRSNPENKNRWVFDKGMPYYPIGIGDCLLGAHGASPLNNFGFDGSVRDATHTDGWRTDMETYLTAYSQAGLNLFRWSVDNCAFGLYKTIEPSGNVYLQPEGLYGDQLVQSLRTHGFRTYMVIFGFFPPFPDGNSNPDQMDAIKRYVKYVVDRYGAYVDFWELMNESPNPPIKIADDWYTQVGTYLRQVDPYKHPISTSWQRPDLPVIDITSPHWYARENEFESDLVTIDQINFYRHHSDKPIIFGEQGNSEQNWDERSALRMRIRSWTAFFNEATLIFWNSSCCKDSRGGYASNIYLGLQERGYIKVLQDFVRGLDRRIAPAKIEVSDPARVRGYALAAPTILIAYLHAYTDHTNPTTGISLTADFPVAGTATWIDPSTGSTLATSSVAVGRQTLSVPAFITDVVLRLAP